MAAEKENENQKLGEGKEHSEKKSETALDRRLKRLRHEIGGAHTKEERDKLKDEIESIETWKWKHNYNLGKFKGAKLSKHSDKFGVVEGSVDATPYTARNKSAKWYKEKVKAAKLLLEIYDNDDERFTEDTQGLIAWHISTLKNFAKQKTFSQAAIRKNFELKYKYKKDYLFGAEGIYNFLLAFQRTMDAFGHDEEDMKDSEAVISLIIGGDVKEKDERYVRASDTKLRKKEDPEPTPTPEPKPKPKPTDPKKEDTEPNPKKDPEVEKIGYLDEENPGSKSNYFKVGGQPGALLPASLQFSEKLQPEEASKILITHYKANGVNAFIDGLNAIRSKDPDKAEKVLTEVFEKLHKGDRALGMKLMGEIVKGSAPELKAQYDKTITEAIEKETNLENKKVLKLMKLMNDIKYNVEYPEEAARAAELHKEEAASMSMRSLIKAVADINEEALTGEYKEFHTNLKQSLETRMRASIAHDILDSTRGGLEASFQDKAAKDTTFINSLEELNKMSREDVASSLRNDGLNFIDSDAEIYFSTMHVLEAMQLYITYLYPQKVMAGEKISDPVKWAMEQVVAGTKIELVDGDPRIGKAAYTDVYGNKSITVEKTIDVAKLFVDKEKELDLFDQYQKGEERVGETSIWNWAPTDAGEGAVAGMAYGPWGAAAGAVGGALVDWLGGDEVIEKVKADHRSFGMHHGGVFEEGDVSLLDTSAKLFDCKFENLMEENGKMGAIERLELEKIGHLREVKSYDEARAMAARIIADKLKQPSKEELNKKVREIEEDYETKIRAQVKLMIEKDPRLMGKSYDEIRPIIDKATTQALEDKAYLLVIGENAANMSDTGLSDFEKQALELLNDINGNGTIPISDESMDIVAMVAKTVVEIVVIEVCTMGMASAFAGGLAAVRVGAAGVRVGAAATAAATRGAQVVARGAEVAEKSGRVAQIAYQIGSKSKVAARLGKMLGRSQRAMKGMDWFYDGVTVGARAARGGSKVGKHLVHAAAFAEGQHILHGSTLPIFDDPTRAIYEVGAVAVTLGALRVTQNFMKGGMAVKSSTDTAVKATTKLGRARQIIKIPFSKARGAIGATSGFVGKGLAKAPRPVQLGVELGTEVLALHQVARMEQWAAVKTGVMSQTELDAMKDPVAWHEYAQTAGVVIGLRGWGSLSRRTNYQSQRYNAKRIRKLLNTQDPISSHDQAYLAAQLIVLREGLRGNKFTRAKIEKRVREIFGIEKNIKLNKENFDRETERRISSIKNRGIANLEVEILSNKDELTNIKRQNKDLKSRIEEIEKTLEEADAVTERERSLSRELNEKKLELQKSMQKEVELERELKANEDGLKQMKEIKESMEKTAKEAEERLFEFDAVKKTISDIEKIINDEKTNIIRRVYSRHQVRSIIRKMFNVPRLSRLKIKNWDKLTIERMKNELNPTTTAEKNLMKEMTEFSEAAKVAVFGKDAVDAFNTAAAAPASGTGVTMPTGGAAGAAPAAGTTGTAPTLVSPGAAPAAGAAAVAPTLVSAGSQATATSKPSLYSRFKARVKRALGRSPDPVDPAAAPTTTPDPATSTASTAPLKLGKKFKRKINKVEGKLVSPEALSSGGLTKIARQIRTYRNNVESGNFNRAQLEQIARQLIEVQYKRRGWKKAAKKKINEKYAGDKYEVLRTELHSLTDALHTNFTG